MMNHHSHIIAVKELERTNHLTISRFVNETLAMLFLPGQLREGVIHGYRWCSIYGKSRSKFEKKNPKPSPRHMQ
jgi:hypothetical protein